MTMMSAIVARINNPMIPRAIFGVLNTLLYFPSGAIYPVEALPWWLRAITRFDPFTYAIDGFRGLLLRGTSIGSVMGDIACLAVFGALMGTDQHALYSNARSDRKVFWSLPVLCQCLSLIFVRRIRLLVLSENCKPLSTAVRRPPTLFVKALLFTIRWRVLRCDYLPRGFPGVAWPHSGESGRVRPNESAAASHRKTQSYEVRDTCSRNDRSPGGGCCWAASATEPDWAIGLSKNGGSPHTLRGTGTPRLLLTCCRNRISSQRRHLIYGRLLSIHPEAWRNQFGPTHGGTKRAFARGAGEEQSQARRASFACDAQPTGDRSPQGGRRRVDGRGKARIMRAYYHTLCTRMRNLDPGFGQSIAAFERAEIRKLVVGPRISQSFPATFSAENGHATDGGPTRRRVAVAACPRAGKCSSQAWD